PNFLSHIVHPLVRRADWDEAPFIAGNGTHLAVAWQQYYEDTSDIWFMLYDGKNWSMPEKIVDMYPAIDAWPWVTFLDDGRIIISWWSNRTGTPGLWYKVYDKGIWTEDKRLDTSDDDCDYDPAIIQLNNRSLAIAFTRSTTCNSPYEVYFGILEINEDNNINWISSYKLSNANSSMKLWTPSLTQTSTGEIWVFYTDYEDYDTTDNFGGELPIYFNFTSGLGWAGDLLIHGPGYSMPFPIELQNGTMNLYFCGDDEEREVPDALYYMSYYDGNWHGPFKPSVDSWHAWRPTAAYGPDGLYLVETIWSEDYGNDVGIIPPKPIYQGVAPKADLIEAKVLNKYGFGFDSWIINGIEWAVMHGADIISMSLGSSPTDGTDPLSQAVNWAYEQGVLVVVAAGNYGEYFSISAPGAADRALTIGAVDDNDNLAWFSSRGPTLDSRVKPEMVAPGVDICSSVPGYLFGTPYDCWSGTSMSTPHVAGASALAKQFFRKYYSFEAPPSILKNWLITFATNDLGHDVYSQGAGRLNLKKAFYRELVDHGGAWIHPAVINFGSIPKGEERTAEFYVGEYARSRQYDIHVEVIDVLSGQDVSQAIEVNPTNFSVNGGEEVTVTVTVKSDAPAGLYSGKIKLVDNFGEVYHVIFGAYVGVELTIQKIPWEGPGQEWAVKGDIIQVVILDPDNMLELSLGWQWSWFDENGVARFIVPEGKYEVLTIGQYNDEPVFIAYDNLELTTSTTITLDERNTHYVIFDPNKPKQVYAETFHGLGSDPICLPNASCYSFSISENRWYPRTANTYYSYSEYMWSIDRYVYYPLDDVNPSDPGIIDTSTWHDLIYVQKEISQPISRVADYTQLIRKYTEYRTHAIPKQSAVLGKFVLTMNRGPSGTFGWCMNIPYSRI
ncbi:MAG: S8 family serine peptidase, partial [Ignisphaera sp.]